MTNSETKNFSQNASSSYHLGGECSDECKKDSLNVPKLRFKGYNEEWVEKRIEKVLKIKHGKDKKAIETQDGRYPILATSGEIGRSNTFLWNKPCVLIGRKGTINKPQYMDIPFWTVDTLFYSDVFQENNAKYLYYLFNTINWEKYDESTGVPSLSAKTIERIKIKISNNAQEQEKIASFLTLIDKKIEKQKELVGLLKKYKRGLLSQIFSQKLRFKDENWNNYPDWEEKTLNNIFDTVTDFVAAGSFADLRKNVQYNEKPDFAQLVRTIDLKNNFKNKDFVFISESAYNYLWRVNLNEDALILPNIGANIGEVYYIYSFKLPYKNNVLGPNAILLKSSNNNLYYLYSRCLTDNFRKQLFLQVGASGQPKFNKTDLKKIKIKISINIDEQNKISEFLSKFDEKILQEERILDKLQNYKKGLLQQMFI